MLSRVFAYVVSYWEGQFCDAVSISQFNWKPWLCFDELFFFFFVIASLAIFKNLLHDQTYGVSQESASELE